MSGIAGFVRTDGALARRRDVVRMTDAIAHRGPDGSGVFREGGVALGHRALHGIPEAALESQPCSLGPFTVTADLRLDNRSELADALEIAASALPALGDAALLLRAYEAWGDGCVARLLGDFAFALWNAHERRLLCARDCFGARPFVYGATDRVFAFASDTRALHALGELPRRINEGRVADFIVDGGLETIDASCTFWRDLVRLPAGHLLVFREGVVSLRRYWAPVPRDLGFSSRGEVVEAFRATFTDAVRCRVRGSAVGSMLSGGLDSSSIVAVAKGLGGGPFPTFSAIGDDPAVCPDRAYVGAAVGQGGLDATLIPPSRMAEFAEEIRRHLEQTDDPFDSYVTSVPMVMYAAARRRGLRVLLDGVDGDLVCSQGGHGLAYALREGRFTEAWRRAGNAAHFQGVRSRLPLLLRQGALPCAWASLVRPRLPDGASRWARDARHRREAQEGTRASFIRPSFARAADLEGRFRSMRDTREAAVSGAGPGWDHARNIAWTATAAAFERYDRVAASQSMETSHPFFDRRLVELCLSIPWFHKTHGGWPKSLIRDAFRGVLADPIRSRGTSCSPHFQFTETLLRSLEPWLETQVSHVGIAGAYVEPAAVRDAWEKWRRGDASQADTVLRAGALIAWLGGGAGPG